MKVIIADYDEEAIRLFEEQCKQFSYVELSGKFNDSAETLKYVSRHRVEAAFINMDYGKCKTSQSATEEAGIY